MSAPRVTLTDTLHLSVGGSAAQLDPRQAMDLAVSLTELAGRKGAMTVSTLPKGTALVRQAIALIWAEGRTKDAVDYAKQRWGRTTPEVAENISKAAVEPIGTDATAIVRTPAATEYLEALRPLTVLDRLAGTRRAVFNTPIPRQNAPGTIGWAGEKRPKPAGAFSFDSITLAPTKAAGIVVISDELVMLSTPSAEAVIRQELLAASALFHDQQLLDPTIAADGTISPAAITYNATHYTMSGTSVANVVADLKKLIDALVAANCNFRRPYWVMTGRTAATLATLRTSADVHAFPNITPMGGTLYGIPVLTTSAIPTDTGADQYIVLLDASELIIADDGPVRLDASREACVQLTTDPQTGAQSLFSLWQNDCRAIRVERAINYRMARPCIAYLDGVSY